MRTALASEAEFIAEFHELCDETTIFAPTEKMKPVGADCAFSLELADGTPMVRGLGKIRNAWPTDDSPFGRPGIHIEIGQLTDSSKPIVAKLLTANRPRTRPAPSTHQLWGAPSGPPTEEMDIPEIDEPEAAELPQKITRELVSVSPPEDLTDHVTSEDEARPASHRRGTAPVAVVPVPVPRPRVASAPILPQPVTTPPPLGSAQASAIESSFDLDDALAVARNRPWWMNPRVGAVFAGGLALGILLTIVFRSPSTVQVQVTPAALPAVAAAMPPPPPVEATPVAANCPPPEVAPIAAEALVVETPPPAPPETKPAPAPKRAAKPAPTQEVAAKPAPASAPTKSAPVAKVTKAAPAPKPASAAKVATKPAKKRAKSACSSLDCI